MGKKHWNSVFFWFEYSFRCYRDTKTTKKPVSRIDTLSKTLMYDQFHYNYIRQKYTNCQLLFTDTDSLFYRIKTEGHVHEDFFKDRSLFDNSDYPKSSKFFSGENKKVISKFKDEAAGKPSLEFFGPKSKMYSYTKGEYETVKLEIYFKDGKLTYEIVKAGEDEKFIKKYLESIDRKAKGVKKNVIKREISQSVIFDNKMMHHQMKSIRSEKHQISSYHLNKVSLSPFDDNRCILKASLVMLTDIKKKLINYDNYMTPEEVARGIIGVGDSITDNSIIDDCIKVIKRSSNNFSAVKRREVERIGKRVRNINYQKKLQKQ